MTKRQHRKHQKRNDPAVRNAQERAREAWKGAGKSLARGSTHAARADLKETTKEASTFVVAFIKAVFMTAVALSRMSFSMMR